MGVLSKLVEEKKVANIQTYKSDLIESCAALMESTRPEDEGLRKMFESDSDSERYTAAVTMQVLDNQQKFLDGLMTMYGEATVMGSLGALTPKVMDVVRIFYPNQVAHLLTDIQPLTQQTGQIFIMKPIYSQTAAGVTAGQEVFRNMSDGNYASESYTAALGTANGSATVFGASLTIPVRTDGTIKIFRSGAGLTPVATDNGAGVITGLDGAVSVSGTINYQTGVLSVTWGTAPANGQVLTATYLVDSETNVSQIRELEISLSMVPVRAQEHPLKVKHSITAQLAASAHLGIDIPDVLTTVAAQFVKVERDRLIISAISNAATNDTILDYNAAANTSIPRWQQYQEIEQKLNAGEANIQSNNGNRGGVSWVLCGYNSANIWRNVRGFISEKVVAPIGAHKIGSLRDGTVDVIKAPFLDTNQYIIGFKGYMPGDSATILAEWVPMYFTPVFNSPNLQAERGVMSLYDLFVNNAGYYRKGVITNFGA